MKTTSPIAAFFRYSPKGRSLYLKKQTIDIKKADYNIQFNVGSQDDKILKKSEFYTLKDKQVIELPSSKKKIIALFGDKSEVMEVFIKENDLIESTKTRLNSK